MFDSHLSEYLHDDIHAQLTRDADRAYQIELRLRGTMPPAARMALQREYAELRAVTR